MWEDHVRGDRFYAYAQHADLVVSSDFIDWGAGLFHLAGPREASVNTTSGNSGADTHQVTNVLRMHLLH